MVVSRKGYNAYCCGIYVPKTDRSIIVKTKEYLACTNTSMRRTDNGILLVVYIFTTVISISSIPAIYKSLYKALIYKPFLLIN
jgi:hypothetical protein